MACPNRANPVRPHLADRRLRDRGTGPHARERGAIWAEAALRTQRRSRSKAGPSPAVKLHLFRLQAGAAYPISHAEEGQTPVAPPISYLGSRVLRPAERHRQRQTNLTLARDTHDYAKRLP